MIFRVLLLTLILAPVCFISLFDNLRVCRFILFYVLPPCWLVAACLVIGKLLTAGG